MARLLSLPRRPAQNRGRQDEDPGQRLQRLPHYPRAGQRRTARKVEPERPQLFPHRRDQRRLFLQQLPHRRVSERIALTSRCHRGPKLEANLSRHYLIRTDHLVARASVACDETCSGSLSALMMEVMKQAALLPLVAFLIVAPWRVSVGAEGGHDFGKWEK